MSLNLKFYIPFYKSIQKDGSLACMKFLYVHVLTWIGGGECVDGWGCVWGGEGEGISASHSLSHDTLPTVIIHIMLKGIFPYIIVLVPGEAFGRQHIPEVPRTSLDE